MINIGAARSRLADLLGDLDAEVVRAGIDGIAEFPAVIIGQADWSEADLTMSQFERSTFPVAVVVKRSGDDTADIDALDNLWPTVLDRLKAAARADPSLGSVCRAAVVTRARFGLYSVQGASYPAQMIFIDLYG